MPGKRITELDFVTSTSLTDIVPTVNEGLTRKVTLDKILRAAAARVRNTIHVSINGDDVNGDGSMNAPYQSIGQAITDVVAPSLTNPYEIVLHPGTYTELNPLTLPTYTVLTGQGGVALNRIIANDPDNPLFVLNPFGGIVGATLFGSTNSNSVLYSGVGPAFIRKSLFRDSNCAVQINNANANLDIYDVFTFTETDPFNCVIHCLAGEVKIWQFNVLDTQATTLIRAEGVDSNVHIWDFISYAAVTNGFYASDGAIIHGSNIEINNAVNTLRANTGSRIYGSGYFTHSGSTFDILQEDTESEFVLTAGELNEEKFSVQDWSKINVSFRSRLIGDEAFIHKEELHVGSAELGRGTVLGEGDSTTRGILVYTSDGVSLTDVSDEAKSRTGSTFTYPITTNSALYIGWDLQNVDYMKFYGIKVNVVTPTVLGAGAAAWEFWNGSAWVGFDVMNTEANSPYLPLDGKCFEEAGENHLRFDIRLSLDSFGWTKNDPISSGIPRYWVRYRIVSDITTAATLEYIKIHTNRKEVNADGWVEYFGTARPIGPVPSWDHRSFTFGSGVPTSQDLYLSDNISVNLDYNEFGDTGTDRIGMNAFLPYDFDTSSPLRIRWAWRTNNSGSGFVRWRFRWSYSQDGAGIFENTTGAPASHENEQSVVVDVPIDPNSEEQQFTSDVFLSFAGAISRRSGISGEFGDVIWLSIERDGSNDTHPGDVALVALSPTYVKWCDGGHIA